jgi:PAS domain S-box-containing protein
MMRPRTLRVQLIVILCTFLAVTLGTLGIFVNAFNQRAIAEQVRDREELFARNVQVSINQVLFAGKYQAQAYLEALDQREPTVRYLAIVEAATGRVIAHSDPAKVGTIETDGTLRRALEVARTGQPIEQRFDGPDGVPIHEWDLPYERGYLRTREGVIRIGLSGEREAALRRQSLVFTALLVAAFLVAGLLLAVWLSIRLTSGLRAMTTAAAAFGEGRYDARVTVPEPPRDELDQLGMALNAMAERLAGYAEHLERQVRERTAQLADANRALREGEARLMAFINNANAAIYLKDTQGRYVLANRANAALYGLTPEDLLGRTERELRPNGLPESCEISDAQVLREGRSIELEEMVQLSDGAHAFLTVKFPMRDEAGAIYGIGGVSTDITERQRLESELRTQNAKLTQLDRLKNEFVNAVSHDLRTPLTSILGYSEFLEDEIGGTLTEDQREFVTQIQMGTKRLEALVDDLLDFARIEAGTFRLRLASGDLRDSVREIVDSLRPQADGAHLHLHVEAPEQPLDVVMDRRRIQQVLTNLLHNAIKFTPPGGDITVRLQADGPCVRGEVSDTGPGIAAEDLPRLFQRFSQLQRGMAKGGTGLGLAISRSIIEAHGGHIGVESRPGVGSTFWFTLPISGPEGPNRPAEEA